MKNSDLVKLVLDLHSRVEKLEAQLGMESFVQNIPRVPVPPPMREEQPAAPVPPEEVDLDFSRMEEMSNSELVQFCWIMGYPSASRQLPREDLLDLLTAEDGAQVVDPLSEVREATFSFVSKKNSTMLASIQNQHCDLNCPRCPHHKVIDCWSDNRNLVLET